MHRILFRIGGLEFPAYGVMLAAGVLAGAVFTIWRNKSPRTTPAHIMEFSLSLLLGGLIGARLIYCLLHFHEYLGRPASILMLRDGGLSWHGALAGGFVSFFLFCRQKKLDLAEFLDLCLPGVALGMAVGRLGCFLNGCCVGSETHAPWGVVFREAGFLTPRHPTQLYEVVLNLVIVGVLCAWEKRRRVAGEITLLYFITWSAARFLVEIFRLSPPRILGLSIAQYASIVIFVLSLWWFRRARMTGAVTPWSKGGEEASPRRE